MEFNRNWYGVRLASPSFLFCSRIYWDFPGMTPTTPRWQATRPFPETDQYWARIEWIGTKPRFFPHRRLRPTKNNEQHVPPYSEEKASPPRTAPSENPVVGLLVFLSFVLAIFFGGHWMKQSLAESLGHLDLQIFLFSLLRN